MTKSDQSQEHDDNASFKEYDKFQINSTGFDINSKDKAPQAAKVGKEDFHTVNKKF